MGELSWDDTADFADADRGFLGALRPGVVKDADGKVVWDSDAYAFLEQPCPETANPSLWRQGQLCARQGLYEVTDGIYQVRGLDISNMTLVEGTKGRGADDVRRSGRCPVRLAPLAHLGRRPYRDVPVAAARPLRLPARSDVASAQPGLYRCGDRRDDRAAAGTGGRVAHPRLLRLCRVPRRHRPLLAKARTYAADDPRFAAQLLQHAVFAEPDNAEAKELLAQVYERLGYGAENGTWRNFYLTGAQELRHGVPKNTAVDLGSGMAAALSVEQIFDTLASASTRHTPGTKRFPSIGCSPTAGSACEPLFAMAFWCSNRTRVRARPT